VVTRMGTLHLAFLGNKNFLFQRLAGGQDVVDRLTSPLPVTGIQASSIRLKRFGEQAFFSRAINSVPYSLDIFHYIKYFITRMNIWYYKFFELFTNSPYKKLFLMGVFLLCITVPVF
jgi:hypothetical protein